MALDFHSHLQDIKNYEYENTVEAFISGYGKEGNRKALSLAKSLNLKYYVGLAPQEAQRMDEKSIEEEIEFIRKNSKHAIGEIGMDFHWAKNEREVSLQKYAFEKQIELAEKLKLPVVIHSRKAEEYIIDYLIESNFSQKVAFHFFSGKLEVAKKALKNLDSYFSIIIFPSKERKKLIQHVEIERLLVETDSPYVGKTPNDVFKSISYISRIKLMKEENVETQTSLNAYSFIKK